MNGVVLFIVARPARALLLLCVHLATVAALVGASAAMNNDSLFTIAICIFMLGPTCIAGIEYYSHETALKRGALRHPFTVPPDRTELNPATENEQATSDARPRFLGTHDLERLRNELEIAIFHRTDRIELLVKLSYFAASLQAIIAALDDQWLDVSISLLMVGLAYTVRAHESKVFAIAYTVFGIFVGAEFIHRSSNAGAGQGVSALPILITILGVGLTNTCFSLARLRRLRANISLEPASHLADV